MPHILYSFRRCPYAMRARLALAFAGISYEHREVDLKAKPADLIAISAKATVPVLQLSNTKIIDESYDIVMWALDQHYPEGWQVMTAEMSADAESCYRQLQHSFIPSLNKIKYPNRYEQVDMEAELSNAKQFFIVLNNYLEQQAFICGDAPSYIDILTFPFMRQFDIAASDFMRQIASDNLLSWFDFWLQHPVFQKIMQKHAVWQKNT